MKPTVLGCGRVGHQTAEVVGFGVLVAVPEERLVEVETGEQSAVFPPQAAGLDGTKTFRAYDQHQPFLLPPSLLDWLPQQHLARTIDALVEDTFDLSPALVSYVGERGFPGAVWARSMLEVARSQATNQLKALLVDGDDQLRGGWTIVAPTNSSPAVPGCTAPTTESSRCGALLAGG